LLYALQFKFQILSIKYQTLFGIWDLEFGILNFNSCLIAFSFFFVAQRAMRVSLEIMGSARNRESPDIY